MNTNINLSFLVISLIYISFLNIVFLKKEHIKTFEINIFGKMIKLNLLGIILEFGCTFSIIFLKEKLIIQLINKLFLAYLLSFVFLFSLYVFSVSFSNNKDKIKKIKKIILPIYLLMLILVFVLEVKIHNDNNVIYSYGPSTNIVFFASFMCVIFCLIAMIKNYKNLKSKKYLPLFTFIIGGTAITIIQKINPALTLASSMEAFLLMVMYFTIENPDMKMLDEVHKAKVISDNANEEKTLFLYNMTNEIRGITKDIDKEADNILDETDNKKVDIEVISDSAREIKGSTARFTSMTNEILDISSVDSASVKIYNEKYNIKILLKELVQIYKKQATDKGLDFRVSIASDIPEYLYGDNIRLKKALTIILDNSIKYTNSGYVEFNVNTIIKKEIARLIISVEDSGIGIKAEDLNKIFVKKQEKEENHNLNNNLYNAKRLITLMNGTIVPTSSYGSGTTIKVILDQKYKDNNMNLNKYDNIYDKKKILLIDDSPYSEKLLNKVLSGTNIEVNSVKSGKEGLEKIRSKEKYDLILLKEELEPQDGHIIMQKLLMIRNFNTKVILLTRDNKYEYDEEYLREGFTDYIIKSSRKEEILNKINKYLK
ncbi:MAG: hybrid sensor histidine kinase/response regulator [Bacilli bacterium]